MRNPSTAKISSAEYNILEVINRKNFFRKIFFRKKFLPLRYYIVHFKILALLPMLFKLSLPSLDPEEKENDQILHACVCLLTLTSSSQISSIAGTFNHTHTHTPLILTP